MHAALSGTNLLWHTACCMPCSCLAAGVPAVLHLSMCCTLQCPARRPAAPAGPQGAGGRRRRPGGTAAGGLDWAEWGGISVACLAVTNWECLCRRSQHPASIAPRPIQPSAHRPMSCCCPRFSRCCRWRMQRGRMMKPMSACCVSWRLHGTWMPRLVSCCGAERRLLRNTAAALDRWLRPRGA